MTQIDTAQAAPDTGQQPAGPAPDGMPGKPVSSQPPATPTQQTQTPPADQPGEDSTPEWKQSIPEKFRNHDTPEAALKAMGESLTHAERRITEMGQAPKIEKASDQPAAEIGDVSAMTSTEYLSAKGVDAETIDAELAEHGKLTDDTLGKVVKQLGLPPDLVADYFASKELAARTVQARANEDAAQLFGGHDQLDQAMEWARDNLSAQDIDWFNQTAAAAKNFSDPNALDNARRASEWLHSKWQAANGGQTQPQPQPARSGPVQNAVAAPAGGGGVQPFASREEAAAATADPRFAESHMGMKNPHHDPAYHQEVKARMQVSNY